MAKLRIDIPSPDPGEQVSLEALDVAAALTIADINLARGDAEIWDGEKRLARLTKEGEGRATFWRVQANDEES